MILLTRMARMGFPWLFFVKNILYVTFHYKISAFHAIGVEIGEKIDDYDNTKGSWRNETDFIQVLLLHGGDDNGQQFYQ